MRIDVVSANGSSTGGRSRGKAAALLVLTLILVLVLGMLMSAGCGKEDEAPGEEELMASFRLDGDSEGCLEEVSNIVNTAVVSNDPNVYKAEYEAGFIQGHLQEESIIAFRDNCWDSAYLLDPSHTYPKQIPPSDDEVAMAERTLQANWDYTMGYIDREGASETGKNLRRLMYRLIGIYDGASMDEPQALAFDDTWFPDFSDEEMSLGYETPALTFLDVYYVNADQDVFYLLPDYAPAAVASGQSSLASAAREWPGKCSAFVKKTGGEIYLTHNSWNTYLDQSQSLTLCVNGDFMTADLGGPGCIGSGVDFGYNNKGIIFNETTHRFSYNEPKVDALWMFWRAALAEQFASSIDEFFQSISLEASGTYMNGYMVVDAVRDEIGLVEMSYDSFVFFKPDGQGGVAVTTKPEGLNTDYDQELVQPDFILGINFPASMLVREELQSEDNRPARRRQFLAQIGGVVDMETSKALVTYTDPQNPLSIYGRWDLGYGETPDPKTIPEGSVDAKAVSASMVRETFELEGVLDLQSPVKAYWMKFGTPYVDGKPFIWSESQWSGQKLREVPDVVDGQWELLNTYVR